LYNNHEHNKELESCGIICKVADNKIGRFNKIESAIECLAEYSWSANRYTHWQIGDAILSEIEGYF